MADVHDGHEGQGGIKLFGATIAVEPRQSKEDHELSKSDQTAEKRPDKIIPCPRCKSMETKFCYFNNYNVNQPRHFCKGCQRYWTAGGALRNVPVGAGRRKARPPGEAPPALSFSETCQLEFDDQRVVMEEWPADDDGFRHVFPAKRRRSDLGGQSC
ncbi:hypothetical protein NMG60_11014975 [Bertholletia excelsa]